MATNKTNLFVYPYAHFETPTRMRRVLNFVLVPLLNVLSPHLLSWATRSHKAVEEVVANKTEHVALEILYLDGSMFPSKNVFQKIALWVWFGLDNPRAVRNRLRIVRSELANEMATQLKHKKKIFILNIASGSARAVLEAAQDILDHVDTHVEIHITFLDKNPKATEYSSALADEMGLSEHPSFHLTWLSKNLGDYLRNDATRPNFDIVEMVGLLDYFTEEKMRAVFREIHSVLNPNGLFICANVMPNREQAFLTNFVGWRMIYKSPHTLVNALTEAGFPREYIAPYSEPLNVHTVVTARNTLS